MNRFPIKVTYGIMATLELARQDRSIPLQAKIIAKKQQIPSRFIEQILQRLKHAGLVRSLRGAYGGYTLALAPDQISMAQLVKAMNGADPPLKESNGVSERKINGDQVSHALLSTIWQQVEEAEQNVLRDISVQSLLDHYEKLETERGLMYHI